MADAPSDGVTGAGGAGEEPAPAGRLPVVSEPIFTTFGGAAGETGSADAGAPSSSENNGGAGKPSGGTTGHGGAQPVMGGTSSAGSKATGGAAAGGDVGTGGDGPPVGEPPALFFSEYVEGSGSFKALEIYALTAASLEGCELQTYFNGKLEPSRLALHGELSAGGLQVLCSSALATAQPSACDRSTNLTFNGDDALALSCGGVVLDVIGQVGVDPGAAWSLGATADHTLRRRCSVTQGHGNGAQAFEVDPEWIIFGADTISGLRTRDCAVR